MKTIDPPSLGQRMKAGRALRDGVPRASQGTLGRIKRDALELLEASSAGRIERLVALRYGRMLASPFAFFRGSAAVQAHDLSKTPHTGLLQQICGDAHLKNFGGFTTPERNLVFDVNDFDETHPGPWEWDVKRLAASFTVAARHLGLKKAAADEVVFDAVEHYARRMAQCASQGALDLWYERVTFESMLEDVQREEGGRRQEARALEKAMGRASVGLLPKYARGKGGRFILGDEPPAVFHVDRAKTLIPAKDRWMKMDESVVHDVLYRRYLDCIAPSTRALLGRFRMQDVAFKVLGVGSVGTRCAVMLMADARDEPLFLQVKEARRSVLAPYVPAAARSAVKHQGQRVVLGERLMQAASDPFLGWSTGSRGREFYLRQLRDMKVSFDLETLSRPMFGRYAWLCCDILARTHARAGGLAPEISGYLGKGSTFARAMVRYANGYADQVERDFEAFRGACRQGRLEARTEADFAADFRV